MNSTQPQIIVEHKYFDGWLFLFCLSLTVLNPLLAITSQVLRYRYLSLYFDQLPGLIIVTISNGILATGMTIFSIYTGICLWKILPGAVNIAKKYLLAYLGYSMLINLYVKGAAAAVILTGVYIVVCYAYLNKSNRVKSIYGMGETTVKAF